MLGDIEDGVDIEFYKNLGYISCVYFVVRSNVR